MRGHSGGGEVSGLAAVCRLLIEVGRRDLERQAAEAAAQGGTAEPHPEGTRPRSAAEDDVLVPPAAEKVGGDD